MHLGLIGFGSIGRALHGQLSREAGFDFSVLSRSPLKETPDNVRPVRTIDALIAARPDMVVECAGHAAVRAHAGRLLEAGVPLLIASVGALADEELADAIRARARASGTRLMLPSGAIGGLDLLRAVSAAAPTQVYYRGSKPPEAWQGTPADDRYSLEDLTEPTVIFQGGGREAALAFPKNANVVAALALAGGGFDAVHVALVADPGATGNRHHFRAVSSVCSFEMTIENAASAGNAKTSMTTVLSILQDIRAFAGAMSPRGENV